MRPTGFTILLFESVQYLDSARAYIDGSSHPPLIVGKITDRTAIRTFAKKLISLARGTVSRLNENYVIHSQELNLKLRDWSKERSAYYPTKVK